MKNVSKKWIALIVVAVVASSLIALAGCSPSSSGSSESSSAAGMANPWSEAASAEEAAAGAGIDSFALPEGEIADMGKPLEVTYRYMDGMAEAQYDFGASMVTVRTAKLAEGDSYDISGDYNSYTEEWTETISNMPIACAGNKKGESIKTYWGEEDVAHSIVAQGLGGDNDFGLTVDRLTVFVEAMK